MSQSPSDDPWTDVIKIEKTKKTEEEKRKYLEAVFIKAVKLGDAKTFQRCLKRKVDPNTASISDNTALHIVAEYGSFVIAKRLLKMPNLIIDPLSQHGYTPLLLASLVGNIYVMILLIEHGADIYATDHFGRTPLHLAVFQKHLDAALILLKSRADPNQFDSNGLTPLHTAAITCRHYSLTLVLLKYGANPNISYPGHLNVFLELCLVTNDFVYERILKLIIKRVPDVNLAESISLRNGLHLGALSNYTPTIKLLLDKGANRHLQDIKGFRPIDTARVFYHYAVANFLDTYIPERERFRKVTIE